MPGIVLRVGDALCPIPRFFASFSPPWCPSCGKAMVSWEVPTWQHIGRQRGPRAVQVSLAGRRFCAARQRLCGQRALRVLCALAQDHRSGDPERKGTGCILLDFYPLPGVSVNAEAPVRPRPDDSLASPARLNCSQSIRWGRAAALLVGTRASRSAHLWVAKATCSGCSLIYALKSPASRVGTCIAHTASSRHSHAQRKPAPIPFRHFGETHAWYMRQASPQQMPLRMQARSMLRARLGVAGLALRHLRGCLGGPACLLPKLGRAPALQRGVTTASSAPAAHGAPPGRGLGSNSTT